MAHPEYIGKYTIKTLLGEGAMGVVYKAFDPGIGRLVAIKTIRHTLSHDREAQKSLLDRFRNEARAVGRLSHPNIVAIYELGQDADHAYIVMEYVEGRDLSKILENNRALPRAEVLTLMLALLDALEAAHRHGVWHRDIKPANLIISDSGQLKVTDFGIARIESAALTQVAMVIGTPGFMAPEQYMGEKIDQRVDIFAAGVLLYRLLSGQMPFAGTPEAVMYAVMSKAPVPLSQFLSPELLAQFEPIVLRALAKDPADRYASAAEFAGALRDAGSGQSGASGQTTLVTAVASGAMQAALTPAAVSSSTGGAAATTAPTHWEDATLASVQAVLARFVGPMAKVQVRQAAKKCQSLPDLVALLSQELVDPQQRASFVSQMQTQSATTLVRVATVAGSLAPVAARQTAAQPVEAVSEALLEQATRTLTRAMGPIAKVVVKKAAARASSAAQFVALLAEELPAGQERAQLLAELGMSTQQRHG
jgi:tRNA A-37 threonylcarbamoyl transferase component Bud32